MRAWIYPENPADAIDDPSVHRTGGWRVVIEKLVEGKSVEIVRSTWELTLNEALAHVEIRWPSSPRWIDYGTGEPIDLASVARQPCKPCLSAIYRAYRIRTAARIAFIDEWLGAEVEAPEPIIDDRRNEAALYAALFSNGCCAEIEDCFREAMRRMRGKSFSESEDDLNALAFLQDVVAAAMWKHRCDTGDMLETFAREFDRLDVEVERIKLHLRAQKV